MKVGNDGDTTKGQSVAVASAFPVTNPAGRLLMGPLSEWRVFRPKRFNRLVTWTPL